MAQPSTPGQAPTSSIFGGPAAHAPAPTRPSSAITSLTLSGTSSMNAAPIPTPTSAASSSNNTYIMPNSPVRTRPVSDGYRPKITRTLGQRPACLVNASVTYCGNNQIYAFGGFDQYTDEVYNHVLRLDLISHQWSLVDNYGDIPGVRMGHTATLYQGEKLLVFGGENEHRTYLSDLIVFDLKTAHWTQPQVFGPIPKGRARHAAVLHEDKLFIIGGITGQNNYVLDDICYLDLRTFTWSKAWRFVGRFDHSAYIWNDRVWVFGGLSEDMDKISDLWWLDLKGCPEFDSRPHIGVFDRNSAAGRTSGSPRPPYTMAPAPVVGSSGYAANSRTAQVNPPSFQLKSYAPMAPGTISAVKFMFGQALPSQGSGIHYHQYASGTLLDFVTPAATITPRECSLSVLDLNTLRWQKLAEGREIFKSGYRWHYCTMNEDGTKAWLLGCPTDPASTDMGPNGYEEYLSDIMEIDLRRYGFLGNHMTPEPRTASRPLAHSRASDQPSKGLGGDLAKLFNQPPESGSGTDFIITALAEDYEDDDVLSSGLFRSKSSSQDENWLASDAPTSQPIHVHKLILQARWPHFARLYNAQMAEFHTKKMHIPEPYSVVKAFLLYLYTDSIHGTLEADSDATTDLSDVAGLLVMSNIYNIPHLRLLCVNRLAKELDVENACIIWYCSGLASEEWLRKRAAMYCMTHWGRIVRTQGFLRLPRSALVELSQEIDMEGRVVAGEDLEWGGMNSRYGDGSHGGRKESISSNHQMVESDVDDDEGMEMN
ncbi:kelch repeat protein [Metarhizium acridum CQMa 102]|uniref:Kelch repeat protein n=2 Tax=Metarhizium acridum TaxID=92637 RepID=E9E8K7_METAQ|nr:kelch repeat protein [Metarhizium acridum CQMa 102]EFY87736.1 kelch repeat protein [Metarhizium acridum CQMa 102]